MFKPNMDHLETWPPIYVPGQTYIPFSWKADNLVDLVDKYIAEDVTRCEIAANAQNTIKTSYQTQTPVQSSLRIFFDLVKNAWVDHKMFYIRLVRILFQYIVKIRWP